MRQRDYKLVKGPVFQAVVPPSSKWRSFTSADTARPRLGPLMDDDEWAGKTRVGTLQGPTSVGQKVLLDLPLRIFHHFHHALGHSLYEAWGKEQTAGYSVGNCLRNTLERWGGGAKEWMEEPHFGRRIWQYVWRDFKCTPVIPLLGNSLKEIGQTEEAFWRKGFLPSNVVDSGKTGSHWKAGQ